MTPELLNYLIENGYIVDEEDLDDLIEDGVIDEEIIDEASKIMGLIPDPDMAAYNKEMKYARKCNPMAEARKGNLWMQDVKKRMQRKGTEGSLTRWAKRAGAMTKSGKINLSKAEKLAKSPTIRKRIGLAKAFRSAQR